MAQLQHISIKTSITAPVITDAMRISLLISIAKQLGVTLNDQARFEIARDNNVVGASN